MILVTVAYPLQTHAGTHTQTSVTRTATGMTIIRDCSTLIMINATNHLKKKHTKLKWTITVKEISVLMLTEENLWPKLIHSFSIST